MANRKTDLAIKLSEMYGDEDQFRAMIDALPTAIYTTDAKGQLTYFNKAAVEFSGRVPELGTDRWCVTWKLFYPDGTVMPHEECPMALTLKEGRSISGVEAIAERPDGKRIWFEPYPSPLYDKNGKLVGGINMLVDITERKAAEKELQESEQRLFLALQAGEIGSWEWDIKNDTIIWSENLEILHGMKPGEFDGKFETFINAVHPDDREQLTKKLEKAQKKGEPYQLEHRWVRKDGDILWFKAKGNVLFDKEGQPEKMVGTCINITERKKGDQLQEIQRQLLEQIASGEPLEDCLSSLCTAVTKISPGTRAAILLISNSEKYFEQVIAPDMLPSFAKSLEGAPVDESKIGTCGEAISRGKPIECSNIEIDNEWSAEWGDFALTNNILACRSNPIISESGKIMGSFMLSFNKARASNDLEKKLSDVASHLAEIALEREHSRSALQKSEDRFRTMMEQSPLSMQIFDANGNSIQVNKAWEQMWDATKEEIGHYNILKDEQLKKSGVHNLIRDAFAGEVIRLPIVEYDPAKIGKSGRKRWIEAFLYPLTDVGKDNFEMALVHHDITERKNAEEALLESEAKLETELVESAALQNLSVQLIEEDNIDGLYEKIMDAAVDIMHANFASLQMFYPERGKTGELQLIAFRGFNPAAAKFWDWVTPASDSTCGVSLRTKKRVIVSDVHDADFMQGTDDLKMYIETGIKAVQTTPLFSRSGSLLGMISTHWKDTYNPSEHNLRLLDILARQAADLIEKKQAEQELAKSEYLYRTLFESIEEGYCVIEMTFDENEKPVDYTFLESNPACEQIMNVRDVVGKSMREIYADMDNSWFEKYGNVAKTGEPISFEMKTNRINKWLQVYAFRFGNPENNQVAVLFSDITSRKESEHSNALLGAIIDSSEDAIISKDLNGIITSWNPSAERLFGYTEEEVVGKNVTILFPPGKEEEEDFILDQIKQGKPIDHFETTRLQKDGSIVDISLTMSPVRDSEGNIVGASKIARDITRRKQSEKKLKELNETLEERVKERTATLLSYQEQLRALASQLSKAEEHERQRLATDLHDNLGQLLAVGKMRIDLLLKKHTDADILEDVGDVADLMNEAITYTRALMTDLKPPPSLDREDIASSISWTANKMEKHGLDVEIIDDNKPKSLNEEVQATLRQCVRELLFNIVKHADTNKAIIHINRLKDQVQIIVEDKGEGFNPDKNNNGPIELGGFGLFNIRERINLLGGELNIESEPGKGTKAIIFVPLVAQDGSEIKSSTKKEKTESTDNQSETSEPNQHIKVLLVDDHRMMREGLRKMIDSEDDLRVLAEATNGEEAVKLAREITPDVIVMDVNMPGMNGIEATREIYSNSPKVRIVGLSLHDNEEVAQAMRKAGASAYLTKADVFETLVATIRGEGEAIKQ